MDKPILPDLFKTIQEVHPTLQGWCSIDKALTLASLVIATRPEVILEVGVFNGKSLIPMALACKTVNRGVVIGVDSWSKEIAVKEQVSDADRDWWAAVDMEGIYQSFLKHLSDHKLESFTKIHRKQSKDFDPPNVIHALHLDGSHSETAYRDIVKFGPRVAVGSWVCTDDSDWSGGGVTRAEQWLEKNGFKRLYQLGTGWVFQRVR